MKLIEIYHQFFRISGDDGVYYCTNADTDAALNVKAVHHVRTDATELPYDYRMLPPLTLRGRDIEKIKPLHKGLGMPYTPISKRVNILKTQTPDSMGYESHRALDKLQKAVGGDTTNFVCERLQWTREQIKERLFAEQVDAVALIIYNFEARHQSVIIGDQTGIGKGRVASSIIRYAVVQGLIPVYCTENTGLFSDNYRDLCDIGCSDLVPFIINSSTSGKTDASIKTLDENDKQVTVYRPIADKKVKEKIYKSGKMPKGYDYILTTYSQLKNAYHKEKDGNITNGEDYLKYSFLKDIAPNAVFIFDESHNISGSKIVQRDWWDTDSGLVLAGSNQFTCFNELCKTSANSVFLSATFAKQPQNMIIYANRTCIAETGLQESELVGAIANGGEALQEIISANIVSEGQMIRRESIYKDIEVNYITLNADNALQYGTPDLEKEHRGMCDYITDLLNQINEFEQTYVMPVIEQINETDTTDIHTSKTDQKLGVGHTPLFSKLFQIVNQLLFAIKAEAVADHAIRRLDEGKKVVIAVSSTMEAFIKSLEDDDNKGEEISCDFALVLDRALENTLKIVRNGEGDFHEKDTIAIDLLPPEGQDMYMTIRENIINAVSNICISPIDLIISRIENAVNPETGENYIVTEVTGRAKKIQFSNPECTSGYIVPRPPVKRNVAFSEFQNNQSDVLIINTSGATGASAHATVKNTNLRPDQVKPRCMIIAQTELDIDKEVQKRGRVNRTGQIYLPTYDYLISAIPAEQRLMMMLQKKLKSLDANSTSNQKQSTNIIDVLDFFNKYGDQVAYEYLEENPDINRKLNNPLGLDENGDKPKSNSDAAENVKKKDFVKRISGYVPLLTCEEQADFYDSVSSNYKKLVDDLKKKGEYDLEVESMDLDAKLIGSLKILQPSSSGNSCFSDAVYQGIYSCKVLRKPYTKEQVAMFIQTITKGGDAKAMAKQTADEYADYYEKKKQQAIDEITKKAEEHKQNVKEVNSKKDGDAKVIEQAINQKWLEIDNETAEAIKNRSFKFDALKRRARFIKFFYAGRACIIEGDHDTKAICLGTEIGNKTKNKFSPSNITITFAVANSIKEMSLTLVDKDITQLEAIMGLSTLDEYADSRFLENWSEYVKESTADREQRNIIVGNLLKGYKNAPEKSKLISFTTHEGEVMKGILTPKDTDSSNTAKVIAAKYSIKECGWVIMDTIRSRNSKTFTLTRGMEIRTNPSGTITLVCTNSETHKHLKDDTEWQQISDSGRGFDVQTQYGKKIWKMSVSDPARLLDLLEKYNISVEFFPTEAQLYFGDRGNDALKQGDWTPLPTDPTNIPTNGDNISPLFDNEIKLLKLKFGGSPLSGSHINKMTAAGQPTTVIISFKKKDVRRSPNNLFEMNTCQSSGQHNRPYVGRANQSGSNYLSGAKLRKRGEFAKQLAKKIANWDKNPISDSRTFVLGIGNLIGAEGDTESKYKICIEDNGKSYSLRISLHNANVENYRRHGNAAKNKYGVTFKPKDEPSSFKSHPNIRAIEYVYFEEYTGSEQLKQIAIAILNLLENGVWDESIAPADIKNVSPEVLDGTDEEMYVPFRERLIDAGFVQTYNNAWSHNSGMYHIILNPTKYSIVATPKRQSVFDIKYQVFKYYDDIEADFKKLTDITRNLPKFTPKYSNGDRCYYIGDDKKLYGKSAVINRYDYFSNSYCVTISIELPYRITDKSTFYVAEDDLVSPKLFSNEIALLKLKSGK